MNRDEKYMALAMSVGRIFSKDPSTKVGAVIVGEDHHDVALGYNGFPPGIADDTRLLHRPTKYMLVLHAERNALDNAHFPTRGSTLYATLYPCHECAKSMISKGVARVVVDASAVPGGDWSESFEFARGLFEEAGVRVDQITLVWRPPEFLSTCTRDHEHGALNAGPCNGYLP